jgi:hypothetical protein
MPEGIEIHFDKARGYLSLTCGEAEFARLRDAVCAEAAVAEIVRPAADNVRHIEIESVAEPEAPAGVGPYLARLGCCLVIGSMAVVFGVGLVVVIQWLARRFA